jgi:hypothetical protein
MIRDVANTLPLTHHEILTLVAPFSRSGRQIDLAASDRLARRLMFRPVTHAADTIMAGLPAITERMQLEAAPRVPWRLTRTLDAQDGLRAVLHADGEDPAELLARIDAVPLASQWHPGGTDVASAIAWEHEALRPAGSDGAPRLSLRHAHAQVAGLALQARVSPVAGYPAEIELTAQDGDARVLPDDLLAVLGRPWGPLDRVAGRWRASVQLRGEDPRRSQEAETRLALSVEHLARTLAQPPDAFHRAWRGARWAFALRRTAPLAFGVAFVVAVITAQRTGYASDSTLALLANLAPPLLMGLYFIRREMPRLELPRIPRRLAPQAWQPYPATPAT